VHDAEWPAGDIDRFVLAPLEAAGLCPATPADKPTLIRRATFDLIGLPPTVPEIREFLADDSPAAFAKLVDRLLSSPHFGERWARHWLDLVRYAETRGHEFDPVIPNAYQYRDYVIRALDADVPYDQFVMEHIAGDLLDSPRRHRSGFNESVLGTGFWLLGEEVHSPVDIRGDETDRIDNKIDCMTKTFLGMTVSCSRCHDHKFDAITSRDYYALAGYVTSSVYRQVPFESMEQNRRVAHELSQLRERHRPVLLRTTANQHRAVTSRLADYLLATCSLRRDGSAPVAAVAVEKKLDAVLLGRWVDHLDQATKLTDDPFHLWAIATSHDRPSQAAPTSRAAGRAADGDDRLRVSLQRLLASWRERTQNAADALRAATVVVDYAHSRPSDWLPDGVAFGDRPVRPGDVRFGTAPARPIVGMAAVAAASSDPIWTVHPASDAESDPGKVHWLQAGQTLHTPTFHLTGGKLYYLVRGAGHAYAAVDSHRMINGPLHGALVRSWEDTAGRFQWIEQDLSDYAGHRVHIEFSPKSASSGPSSELAIRLVVEAKQSPGEIDPANALVAELLAQHAARVNGVAPTSTARPLDHLAQAYQRLFTTVVDRLAADSIAGTTDGPAHAALADWMLRHADLWGTGAQVALETEPFLTAQHALLAHIRHESHLAPALFDSSGSDEYLLIRGNPRTPGERVARRFLEAADLPVVAHRTEIGSGRLTLARRMVDPANPLTARVMVNRVWHHLFGRGIVASVDNLGVLGERPTHPELLDYLAGRFVAGGWSLKRLIREVMLSRTYQMSSQSAAAEQSDPQNLLLQHMAVRRLEGETIRDALLAISGRLDRTRFGPSVEVHLSPFMEGRGRPGSSGPLDGAGRRSIYLRQRRNFLDPMFLAFDCPVPFSTIGRRSVSNVPAQALTLLNGEFVVQQAGRWADQVRARTAGTTGRLHEMYEAAFARPPSPAELDHATKFLADQARRYAGDAEDARAWRDLAHVLVNVKEFVLLR
jgi:hypothetical protein